jgi:hypothetical protein
MCPQDTPITGGVSPKSRLARQRCPRIAMGVLIGIGRLFANSPCDDEPKLILLRATPGPSGLD